MKLTRENIYINLQGKSKEELTELYWILKNNNEGFVFIKELNEFLITPLRANNYYLVLSKLSELWVHSDRERETEVTIQQLKEILQPMENTETLQQQLEKAEAEVKRLKEAIEDNKIKVGDVCKFWDNNENSFVIGVVMYIYENARLKYETIYDCQFPNAEKITDQELINKLNELIK